jgi:hypothetical protein
MNALYVEILNIGWNRPKEIKKEEAEQFVEAATNEYRIVRSGNPESKLNKFLEEWKNHPLLPEL